MSAEALQRSGDPLVTIFSGFYLRIGVHKVTGQRNGILFCSAPLAALLGNEVDLGAVLPHWISKCIQNNLMQAISVRQSQDSRTVSHCCEPRA